MEDFTKVIDQIFIWIVQFWSVIRSSWLLSLAVLIVVIGWIVDIINSSRSQ